MLANATSSGWESGIACTGFWRTCERRSFTSQVTQRDGLHVNGVAEHKGRGTGTHQIGRGCESLMDSDRGTPRLAA